MKKIIFLSAQDLEIMHDYAIKIYVHKNIFEMAAAYFYHIIKNHAFIDGNKRTGVIALISF